MLIGTPTRHGAGIALWGDSFDLAHANSVLSYFCLHQAGQSYPEGIYGWLWMMACGARKAAEGLREKRRFIDDNGKRLNYRGVLITWPHFLGCLVILRQCASRRPTEALHQAFIYHLEDIAQGALNEYDPFTAERCVRWLRQPPQFDPDCPTDYLAEITAEFVGNDEGISRFRRLPEALERMSPHSRRYGALRADRRDPGTGKTGISPRGPSLSHVSLAPGARW